MVYLPITSWGSTHKNVGKVSFIFLSQSKNQLAASRSGLACVMETDSLTGTQPPPGVMKITLTVSGEIWSAIVPPSETPIPIDIYTPSVVLCFHDFSLSLECPVLFTIWTRCCSLHYQFGRAQTRTWFTPEHVMPSQLLCTLLSTQACRLRVTAWPAGVTIEQWEVTLANGIPASLDDHNHGQLQNVCTQSILFSAKTIC